MSTAITYSRYGSPDVLTLTEVDTPEPGPGQVRIKVRAVAVNLIDLKIRSGMMDGVFPAEFPVLPGWDVAGVVDKVGEGATASVGDEVFGAASVGGYSEYALLDQPLAKPKEISFDIAAALVTVGETAYRGLHHLGAGEGDTLLIHGAGGSVGTIAVQLAVSRGITVVGTAGEDDIERLTTLGATAVAYGGGWVERVRAAAPQGVDHVFDASGAGVLPDSIALVGDAVRVITIADMSAAQHGVRFTGADSTDRFWQALPRLADLIAVGRLDVPVRRTYPLAEAAQAHADIEARRARGKVILLP
ncbi:NADP-dependent oxidoreductase [Streptomyces olivochromogenes]|uniref:NADP-dependent oxidoreductase n=1 Tax=Streptomyces olivochromogenes TaxID=1963 RepID=UPI001F2E6A5C|nr:NADP-dependent oxidoreductase [Streptomyces olivochromogenes]MCF3130485.1 NADP-dependent oxidoreductase [Streptomyces olivochromogenes]